MKRLTLFCVVVMGSINLINAQSQITTSVRATNFNNRLQQLGGQLRPGDMISGFSSNVGPEVIGDVYWDRHWGKSSLLLNNDSVPLEGYITRYDIQKDEFEFNLSSGVKVIRGSLVKDIIWIDSIKGYQRYLVNAREFTNEGVQVAGFLELLKEGRHSLYKKIVLEVLKPDFNPALNVGSRDFKIIKKVSYYYHIDDNKLVPIKSKKSFQPLEAKKGISIEGSLRVDRIDIKKEADLIKLFSSLNN